MDKQYHICIIMVAISEKIYVFCSIEHILIFISKANNHCYSLTFPELGGHTVTMVNVAQCANIYSARDYNFDLMDTFLYSSIIS